MRKGGFEPPRVASLPPQGSASASSATFARKGTEILLKAPLLFKKNQIGFQRGALFLSDEQLHHLRRPCGILDQDRPKEGRWHGYARAAAEVEHLMRDVEQCKHNQGRIAYLQGRRQKRNDAGEPDETEREGNRQRQDYPYAVIKFLFKNLFMQEIGADSRQGNCRRYARDQHAKAGKGSAERADHFPGESIEEHLGLDADEIGAVVGGEETKPNVDRAKEEGPYPAGFQHDLEKFALVPFPIEMFRVPLLKQAQNDGGEEKRGQEVEGIIAFFQAMGKCGAGA